ncbi:hypothetical protein ACWDLG_23835 [Nonomuraea sp. NPDC003727]
MADSGSKRETLVIWSDRVPTGEGEPHPKAEILRLLGTCQPDQVKGAGSTYISAAEAVINAVVGIEDHAGRILTIWKGPDADRARTALELMYATGQELARKLAEMGRSLEAYAGYIPAAIAEVQGIKVDKTDPQVQEMVRVQKLLLKVDLEGDDETNAIAAVEDLRAQEALKRLNEKIRDLHLTSVPYNITYELPAVTIPAGPGGDLTSVQYGGTSGSQGPTFGDGDPGADRASVSGSGGTGETATRVAADGHQDDVRPGGDDGAVPGTQPAEQPGQEQPGDGQRPGGGDGSGQQPGGQSTSAGTEDGTAPPVIGAQDRTDLDDATPEADPARTETSAYQPPTTTPTTIGNHPPRTAIPATTPTPTGTTPGVPSVIGSPNSAYTPGGRLGAMRGGSPAGLSGMPFLPMMGTGGPMGDEGGDLERATHLSEDRSAWTSSHDVTDPVIG